MEHELRKVDTSRIVSRIVWLLASEREGGARGITKKHGNADYHFVFFRLLAAVAAQ
jgi:hypothetical protein